MIFNSNQLDNPPVKPRLLAGIFEEKNHTLENYTAAGGYKTTKNIINGSNYPGDIRKKINKIGLRERGGLQEKPAVQWTEENSGGYLVGTGMEFEPGGFKNRILIEKRPHLLLEGIILAAYALKTKMCYIYVRAAHSKAHRRLKNAIEEARKAGYLGEGIFSSNVDCSVKLIRGTNSHICKNQSALINSIRGKRPYPRPVLPKQTPELFDLPAVIHNTETLAIIPFILEKEPGWLERWGTEKNPGFRLFTVVGAVNRPGIFEAPTNISPDLLINKYCEGPAKPGLKALLPGGITFPQPVKRIDNASMDSPEAGNIIVIGKNDCMVRLARNCAKFYARQSCGYCTPCREGITQLAEYLDLLHQEKTDQSDFEKIKKLCKTISGSCYCPQGNRGGLFIQKIIAGWPDDFTRNFGARGCEICND